MGPFKTWPTISKWLTWFHYKVSLCRHVVNRLTFCLRCQFHTKTHSECVGVCVFVCIFKDKQMCKSIFCDMWNVFYGFLPLNKKIPHFYLNQLVPFLPVSCTHRIPSLRRLWTGGWRCAGSLPHTCPSGPLPGPWPANPRPLRCCGSASCCSYVGLIQAHCQTQPHTDNTPGWHNTENTQEVSFGRGFRFRERNTNTWFDFVSYKVNQTLEGHLVSKTLPSSRVPL